MSKIEVNEIDAQSGTTITVGSACKSVAVPGNVVKSNALQASDGGNIVNQSGTTITLGASGDTVTLASGASQSGFGRTGTVDWQTGSVKTSDFTAVDGQGFFVDTNGGAVTATLPSGSAGSIISFQDYRNTFDTNALSITPSSGQKINTGAGNIVLSTEGEGVTLVYIDSTVGWRSIQDNVFSDVGSNFISASGGTESISGNCKIHVFTGPGSFVVNSVSPCAPSNKVGYLVVAGGAGGGVNCSGGGGGAGGFREGRCNPITPYTASPLVTTGHPVSVQSYPITVGAGGTATTSPFTGPGANGSRGGDGGVSTFSSFTSAGGGGGGGGSDLNGNNGGSGGGGGHHPGTGGSGNTPPVSPSQGSDGRDSAPGTGPAPSDAGGGGGGATADGQPAPAGRSGGAGATTEITASPVAYAGGGGGTNRCGGSAPLVAGGTGGGGRGGFGPRPTPNTNASGVNGTVNTGGGGGGGKPLCASPGPSRTYGAAGTGGSGIVIIRYKFQ